MDPKTNFPLIVIQTELERFKFLMRSLIRARIAKVRSHGMRAITNQIALYVYPRTDTQTLPFVRPQIDTYPHHYLAQAATNPSLLSHTEHQYLTHHTALLSKHYDASFLNQFPTSLRKMDDTAGGISMVDAPDGDTAVFVRVLRDEAGAVTVPGEKEDGVVELKRGDVWVLRWSAVRDLVLRGLVELV